MTDFNPQMIVLGREARGYNQSTLAGRMSISQSKLSKYESGALQVSEEDAGAIVSELKFTHEFFKMDEDVFGFGSICFYHRKRTSTPVSILRQLQARMNVHRLQARRLCDDIEIDVQFPLPSLDCDEYGSSAAVAVALRKHWKLPLGPIDSVIGILERAGVIIHREDFGTDKLDAISQVIPGFPPVFMVNSRAPGDRLRFTLCHELGHVVMHKNPSGDMEEEADTFASEFLMPADEIGPRLRNISLDKAPALKAHWKVSMAALFKRASDLERITERHYRTLFTQLSKHGWRKREPVDIAIEQPALIARVMEIHQVDHSMTTVDMAKRLMLTSTDEVSSLLPQKPHRLRLVGE